MHLLAAAASSRIPFNPLTVAEVVFPDHLWGDENVSGILNKPSLCIAQKTKSFARNFNDTLS
jgi:hypothetical protein